MTGSGRYYNHSSRSVVTTSSVTSLRIVPDPRYGSVRGERGTVLKFAISKPGIYPATHHREHLTASRSTTTCVRTDLALAPQHPYVERKTISVTGMSCGGCEQNVKNALQNLEGVDRVEADHEADTVELVAEDDVADDDVEAAIENAGYDVAA